MQYAYKKQVQLPFDQAAGKTKEALAVHGFGVITEIDAQEIFWKKLGKKSEAYLILGACHPASAFAVLETEKDLGLMLPCNVVIFENDSQVYVASILPTIMLQMVSSKTLGKIAEEIEGKLKKVVDSVG